MEYPLYPFSIHLTSSLYKDCFFFFKQAMKCWTFNTIFQLSDSNDFIYLFFSKYELPKSHRTVEISE